MTQHYGKHSELEKRRRLRRDATDAEAKLWQVLRSGQLGIRFRRQYSVDAYVLDFYAPRVKLAIEVDGGSHCAPDALRYDAERASYLKRFGIEVLRFTNLEILEQMEGALNVIAAAVKGRGTSPRPSPW